MSFISRTLRTFGLTGEPSGGGAPLSPAEAERSSSSATDSLNPDPESFPRSEPGKDPLREKLFPKNRTRGRRIIYDPPDPVVDIIFVHGLTGDSYSTWAVKSEGKYVYWPFDLLSKDIPNARIIAWGYDADVTKFGIGPVGQNNIGDHAWDLVQDIAAIRVDRRAASRKIIFVAHSLGGLVTKTAISNSERSDRPHMNQLHDHTIAIAFLGTPHAGSSLASFGSAVGNILKVARNRVNTNIMQVLEPNSEVLQKLDEEFSLWMRKNQRGFEVICFYEEKELLGVGMVVSKASATLGSWPRRSIPANHMDMTKFSSNDDEGYERILDDLNRWVGLLPLSSRPSLTDAEIECLKSLSYPQMNQREKSITPVIEGTCEWLLENPLYMKWLSDRQCMVWIRGLPGAGKSTLIKYALKHHPKNDSSLYCDLIIKFFFNGQGAEMEKSPEGLYRALLHQLFRQFPGAFAELSKAYNGTATPNQCSWSVYELQEFLRLGMPRVLEQSPVWIFVDALDECGQTSAKEVVTALGLLQKSCNSAKQKLGICFSCRDYPVIRPENYVSIRVDQYNNKDIATYTRTRLRSELGSGSDSLSLEQDIVSGSRGMFQWASLVVSNVIQLHIEGTPLKQIKKLIETTPPKLYDVYREIFTNLSKQHGLAASLKLFQCLFTCQELLTVEELRSVMNIEYDKEWASFEQFRDRPEFIDTDALMLKQIRSLGGGLVTVVNAESSSNPSDTTASNTEADDEFQGWTLHVRLSHQSVYDFLLADGFRILDSTLNTYKLICGKSEEFMLRICLWHLTLASFSEVKNATDFDDEILDEFPLVTYAFENWRLHAMNLESGGLWQGDLFDYVKKPHVDALNFWVDWADIIGANGGNFLDGYDCEDPELFHRDGNLLHFAAYFDLTSVIESLLTNVDRVATANDDDTDINRQDGYSDTPLHVGLKQNSISVVLSLLKFKELNAGLQNHDGETPLMLALRTGDTTVVTQLLRRDDVNINALDNCYDESVLFRAVGGDQSGGWVHMLLENPKIDVNLSGFKGRTPLHCAIAENNIKGFLLLLSRPDIKADQRDDEGRTPLSHAVEDCDRHFARILLARDDVDGNSLDIQGRSILSHAASSGNLIVVMGLLPMKTVQADLRDKSGRTPLSYAAAGPKKKKNTVIPQEMRYKATVQELMGRDDVNIQSEDQKGWTPLRYAEEGHQNKIIELLRQI